MGGPEIIKPRKSSSGTLPLLPGTLIPPSLLRLASLPPFFFPNPRSRNPYDSSVGQSPKDFTTNHSGYLVGPSRFFVWGIMPGGPLGIPVRQVLQVGANFNGVQEVPDVCFVWVGSRGPITMLVYRLWYRRELPFTIHDAVAATFPIHSPFIPFNIE